ncbi:MAG: PAS/PAC sensor hybrid histidine kinase [uncultured bacterium]|nr:MAG: PAS/PAC sensor hybrid histidine kinase [uncultured bacterium]
MKTIRDKPCSPRVGESPANIRPGSQELEARQWPAIFDAIGDAICLLDPKGEIIRCNAAFADIAGCGEKELQGRFCHEVIHHTSSFIPGCPFPRALQTGKRADLETVVNGRWYRVKVDPVADASGGINLYVHVMVDITARKLAEEKLQESERRYHELFLINPHPMWVYDLETLRFLDVNDAAIAHYQYSRDEFMAMTIKDIRPPEDLPRLLENIAGIEGGIDKAGIWRHLKKDGSLIDVEITSHTMLFDNRPAELILVNDVTEQLRHRAKSELLLAAIEQTDETVLITDSLGRLQYVNPAFSRITGFTSAEALGQKTNIFRSGEHDAPFYNDLWRTLSSGSTWKGRFINRRKDGSLYTEDAVISPVHNATGRIVNYVAVKRDITESLKLEAQLQQAQKMETVGRLAGGVAHDFNNMLSVILGYTEMALEKTDPTAPLHDDLREILNAADRSAKITGQLLAFARKQTITPRVLDLNETVESMLKMLHRLIGEDIDLLWRPGGDLPLVRIDPSQIDQILANLCVNARDAITGVGRLIIETAAATCDAEYCALHAEAVPGEYVQLVVSDDGCGMEKAILDKIFEPFFTTKELGKGTGLGLATVYGIVKQNNGFVNVYSEPGKGTTFRVYLPQCARENSTIAKEGGGTMRRGRGQTVLVVEDETAILRLIGKILSSLGYTVLMARSPSEAVRLANQQATTIDLLITDVIMPEMNGPDLAERIAMLHPHRKCLFMSGYADGMIASQGLLEAGVNFLQKPFTAMALSVKVHEILSS